GRGAATSPHLPLTARKLPLALHRPDSRNRPISDGDSSRFTASKQTVMLLLLILVPPFVGGELLDGSVVACLRSVGKVLVRGMRSLKEVIGKHRPNGMQRVMTRKPLVDEPRHCANDGPHPFGDLVLHDGMEAGMGLEVRHLDSRRPVMRFSERDAFLLVECEPLRRFGLDFRIVVPHEGLPMAANVRHERQTQVGEARLWLSARWRG